MAAKKKIQDLDVPKFTSHTEKPKQKMYMSIENGNLLTWSEMVEEGKELYDLFDDTNCMSWQDYYMECEE